MEKLPIRDCGKGLLGAAVFLGLGLFFGNIFVVKPLSKVNRTKNWVETECVVKSMVFKESGKGPYSKTYMDVCYSYKYDGKEYESKDYRLKKSGPSRYEVNSDIFSPGDKTICYINPDNPAEAVMIEPAHELWLCWGVLPAVFIIIGAGIAIYALYNLRKRS